MGFELGPKLLRKGAARLAAGSGLPAEPPRDVCDHLYGTEGPPDVETSLALTVLWRVEVPGRDPFELEEERSAPMWLGTGGLVGSGNRWYKLRVRPSFGLMRDVGVPCLVDPADPSEIWIDWDAAYKEHVPAWERHARVQQEIGRRAGGGSTASSTASSATPWSARCAIRRRRRSSRSAVARARPRARRGSSSAGWTSWPGSCATAARRPAWSSPTPRPDQTLAGVPLRVLTFEVEGRIVVFEHLFGERHASYYTVGREGRGLGRSREPVCHPPGTLMGFELRPGVLRRAPRGWLAGRAFPLRHSVYSHLAGTGGPASR